MEQEDTMDFKALRAKFQDEEILLRQPRVRPVLPEKPQAVLPPQSPTHHLPAGARPSILTSMGAPRVVFKEEKNSGWMPLTPQSPKTAKTAKTKAGKDKDSKSAKASKDKLDGEDKDASKPKSGKDKKGLLLFKTKETPELVPATAPSKGTLRKIVFPGFKKSSKRGSMDLNQILDSSSPDMGGGQALLVPLVGDGAPAPALPPTTIPDYHSVSALMPPTFIPINPPSSTAPSQAPSVDPPRAPEAAVWQETVTPWEVDPAPALVVETPPAPTIPRPAMPTSVRPPTPSSPAPDRPPALTLALPLSGSFTPPSGPERTSGGEEVELGGSGGDPRAKAMGSASSSPQTGRLSSALERAAEKVTGKRTNPADSRILQALEKARRKVASPSHTPLLLTPTPDDFPLRGSQVDLPSVGYEGPRTPGAAHLNGFENSASEEGPAGLPELMVVPPPPPRRALPDPQVLGPAPQKPARPPHVNLNTFLPPPLEETPALPESWDQDEASDGLPEFEDTHSTRSHTPAASENAWGNEDYSIPNGHIPGIALPDTRTSASTGDEDYGASASDSGTPGFAEAQDVFDSSTLSAPDNPPDFIIPENFGNVYEDVNVSTTKKKSKVEGLKKRKGPPKNPYDETQPSTNEEKGKTIRLGNFRTEKKAPAEGPDEKELKKKEKQRLEKEKKELKEQKEREKREQKEKGKKESDMKKRFNITGQEEAMYQAMATVTTKGRKDDLPVTDGENISIIRTTKCPKGKWLARNNSNTYGYISVDHVKLDIQEMMQMGKKPSSTNPLSSSMVDGGASPGGSRQDLNHYPESTGSFTDDSDEWTGDEEDPATHTDAAGPFPPQSHTRTHSMPETGNKEPGAVHQHSRSDLSPQDPSTQAGNEALNKLATFFHPPKPVVEKQTASTQEESSPAAVVEERVSSPETAPAEEVSGDVSDMLILPPPDVFADTEPETSM